MRLPARVANEELVRERRAHIVSSATHLLLKQGFHKTTIREIATAADLTMGTLYLYISRKEDLLYLIAETIMAHLSDCLRDVEAQEMPLETLRVSADYYFRAVDRLRREVALLYRESASMMPDHLEALKQSELQEREFFANIIRQGIKTGEFRPVDPTLSAHTLIMLAHMWTLNGWTLKDSFNIDEYLEQQIGFFLADLTGKPQGRHSPTRAAIAAGASPR